MLIRLRNKLLFINLISLSIIMFVALSAIYFSTYTRFLSDMDDRLRSIPPGINENQSLYNQSRLENSVNGDSDDEIIINGNSAENSNFSKSFIVNISVDGIVRAYAYVDIENDVALDATKAAISSNLTRGTIEADGKRWRFLKEEGSADTKDEYLTSIRFLDIDDTEKILGSLLARLSVTGAAAIGLILLLSYFIANRAIRPVQESLQKQRQFVADASHELKTPLAIITANAEAARDSEDPSKWLSNIDDATVRMNKLIEGLIYLARAEDVQIEHLPFDLHKAVEEEVGCVEAVLFEKGITLKLVKEATALIIRSDREKLMQALLVLLDNAVKYTDEGGEVTVTVMTVKNAARILVSNSGAYIEAEELTKLFDRFYRSDKSRTRSSGGYGLGLSIAKTIMDRLGGDLTAVSKKIDDNTALNTFTMTIPNR